MDDFEQKFTQLSRNLIALAEQLMKDAPADFEHEDLAGAFMATTIKLYIARIGIPLTAELLQNTASELLLANNSVKSLKAH